VVGHQPGEGRHKGRLGALVVERPGGTRFSVGTGFSDAEREDPPPVGSVITYRYQELTNAGVPRFPSFVGLRDDVKLPPGWSAGGRKAGTAMPTDGTPSRAGRRRFELTDGTSSKFWEVDLRGSVLVVTFGRIGAAGQTKPKPFANAEAASEEAAR